MFRCGGAKHSAPAILHLLSQAIVAPSIRLVHRNLTVPYVFLPVLPHEISQSVSSSLRMAMQQTGEKSLASCPNMVSAAKLVGEAIRKVYQRDAASLKDFGIEFNVSLIFGGQIKGDAPRLFSHYSAGNFIEATNETPYFQIGESKYGKPILDRVIEGKWSLDEVAKCALISMDSTIKSNLPVGLPLDLLCYERDALQVTRHKLIDSKDAYFASIRVRWADQIKKVFNQLPEPGYWP